MFEAAASAVSVQKTKKKRGFVLEFEFFAITLQWYPHD